MHSTAPTSPSYFDNHTKLWSIQILRLKKDVLVKTIPWALSTLTPLVTWAHYKVLGIYKVLFVQSAFYEKYFLQSLFVQIVYDQNIFTANVLTSSAAPNP